MGCIVDDMTLPFLKNFFVFLLQCLILIVLLCTVEIVVRLLTDKGVLFYYQPLILVQEHINKEELRLDFVFAGNEADIEYDPLVFWKAKKNWGVFNEQGFRRSFFESNRNATNSAFTIMTYGDSNTLGIIPGAYVDIPWPDVLADLFLIHGESVRVINMGMMGYSSYQGLQRFRQDVEIYRPSIVIVSFGWNDAAPAMGIPDKQFSSFLSNFFSPLVKIRTFQVIKYYSDVMKSMFLPKALSNDMRVSYEDYEENLIQFVALAKERGITIILLTRPHTEFSDANSTNWRKYVPRYNQIVRSVATTYHVPLLDWEKLYSGEFLNELVDECHLSPLGHEHAGNSIYEFIKTLK